MAVDLTRLPGGAKIGSVPIYTPSGWVYPADDPAANDMLMWQSTGRALWTPPATLAALIDHGLLTGLGDDDHTQYRLESADHSHLSTGLEGGQLTVAALTGTILTQTINF